MNEIASGIAGLAAFVVGVLAVGASLSYLLYWRPKRQPSWMTRVAQRHGGIVCGADTAQRPSFGIRPHGPWARPHTDPRSGFEFAVEIRKDDYQVLGIDYAHDATLQADLEWWLTETPPYNTVKKSPLRTHNFHSVQIKTPMVPTLLIRPYIHPELPTATEFNDLYSMRFSAIHARTRNVDNPLHTPDEPADPTWTDDADFDRLFCVITKDPEFARSVLSPEVIALFLETEWFRVGQVAFQSGCLWTSRKGTLSEETLVESADHLKLLIDLLPKAIWGPYQVNVPGFGR